MKLIVNSDSRWRKTGNPRISAQEGRSVLLRPDLALWGKAGARAQGVGGHHGLGLGVVVRPEGHHLVSVQVISIGGHHGLGLGVVRPEGQHYQKSHISAQEGRSAN